MSPNTCTTALRRLRLPCPVWSVYVYGDDGHGDAGIARTLLPQYLCGRHDHGGRVIRVIPRHHRGDHGDHGRGRGRDHHHGCVRAHAHDDVHGHDGHDRVPPI